MAEEGSDMTTANEAGDACELSVKDVTKVLKELEHIIDWYSLGTYLEVEAHILDAIEEENPTIKRRLIKMLQHWLRTGRCCSWRKLVEALYLMGHLAVADNIRRRHLSLTTPVLPKFLQDHDSYTAFPELRASIVLKNKHRIATKFSLLVTQLRKRFEVLKVDLIDLRTFLTAYGTSISRKDFAVDVAQLDTLAPIFDSIAKYGLWDYLNYDVVGSLVEHFTQQDQICLDLLADYQRDFTGYLLTTEIVHHIATKMGAGLTATPPESILSEELCSKLTVKLAIDVTTHSLQYVEEVWKTLLRRSQLPKHTLLLCDIAESSLMITWLFPKNKAAELADAILQNTHELRLKRVYLITINKSVIFQADLSKLAVDFKAGSAALVAAAKQGSVDLVASLLERGADVNSSKDEEGCTPLVAGCMCGSTELVKLLIEHGADVSMRAGSTTGGEFGFITPLYMALDQGHEEVAALLIEHGADVNALALECKQGEHTVSTTPLVLTVANDLQRATKLLLERGAEVDKETEGDSLSATALMYADNAVVAKLLLDHGAQVDFQGSHGGYTPLTWASVHGRYEVVELLLERGAQVDLQTSGGKTALMCAVVKNKAIPDKDIIGLARLLLQHGASTQVKDIQGKSALSRAVSRGDKELIELLSDPAKASAPRDTSQHTPRPRTEHKKEPRSMFGSFKELFSNLGRASQEVFN